MTKSTLDSLCEIITDGAHKSPKEYPNGIPMMSVKDMTDKSFSYDNCKTISTEDAQELIAGGCRPKTGDVLIAKDGSVLKHVFTVRGPVDYVLLSSIAIIRPKKDKLIPEFLEYMFKNPQFKSMVLSSFLGGSGVPRIVLRDFKKVLIDIPPIQEQKAIAEVLTSLDDKIELLQKQNETLEDLAQTLFRQWFVEEADDSWEESTLNDVLSVKGGATPSTKSPEYWGGDIAWTSPRDITTLNGIHLFRTEKTLTPLGLSKVSSGLLPKGTLLMSSRAPVGVLAFSEIEVAVNQGYIAIADDKVLDKLFIYCWLKENIDIVHAYSNGSTFMEISKKSFKSIKCLIPPKSKHDNFVELVSPLFEKIKLNEKSVLNLSQTRDTLLPKLMSGQVRVKLD